VHKTDMRIATLLYVALSWITKILDRMCFVRLFKMIKGIYDPMCIPCVEFRELSEDLIRTRGNRYRYKLIQHHCHYDLRKFNFTNRVIPIWNSLSDYVVSAETVNTFNKPARQILVYSGCTL